MCNWPRIWSCTFSIDAIDDADDIDEVDDRIKGEGKSNRVKEVNREILQYFKCRNSAFLLSKCS